MKVRLWSAPQAPKSLALGKAEKAASQIERKREVLPMNNSPSLGKGLFLQKMQTGEIEIVLRPGAMTLAAAPPRSRPMVEFDLCPNLASRLMMLRRWVTFISIMSLISSNCSGCKKGASKNYSTSSRPLSIEGGVLPTWFVWERALSDLWPSSPHRDPAVSTFPQDESPSQPTTRYEPTKNLQIAC